MEITPSIIFLIVGMLVGILSSLLGRYIKRKKEKEAQQRELSIGKYFESSLSKYFEPFLSKYKDLIPSSPLKISEYIRPTYERTLRNIIAHSPTSSTETEVENEVKEKFGEIDIRLKEIEKKFPKESTLEKIASVNDAILATNIETLSESIKRIEDKLLTKWDVVRITFQILGGLGILIGIIFAIIKFVS